MEQRITDLLPAPYLPTYSARTVTDPLEFIPAGTVYNTVKVLDSGLEMSGNLQGPDPKTTYSLRANGQTYFQRGSLSGALGFNITEDENGDADGVGVAAYCKNFTIYDTSYNQLIVDSTSLTWFTTSAGEVQAKIGFNPDQGKFYFQGVNIDDPTTDLQIANKHYVDQKVTAATSGAAGIKTINGVSANAQGNFIPATPVGPADVVRKDYADAATTTLTTALNTLKRGIQVAQITSGNQIQPQYGSGGVLFTTSTSDLTCRIENDYTQGALDGSFTPPPNGTTYYLRQSPNGGKWTVTPGSDAGGQSAPTLIFKGCIATTQRPYETLKVEKFAANTWLITPAAPLLSWTMSTVKTAVTGAAASSWTSGELQGAQPAGSVPGMKFCDATYRYEYMNGTNDTDGTSYVWVRTGKA